MKSFWRRKPQDATVTSKDIADKAGWSERLASGLSKTANQLGQGVGDIFLRKSLGIDTLEALEDLLVTADLGPQTATKLVEALAEEKFDKAVSSEDIKRFLSQKIEAILTPCARALTLDFSKTPQIIVMVGVNGTGKTTTIGKLAKAYIEGGKAVGIAAGDTFRAAAIEQINIWGERTGAHVISQDLGSDAAAVAFKAIEQAKAARHDLVLIDTAGRLHNKSNLMNELQKIVRVIGKAEEGAPHHVILTLDATTGQNAFAQVEAFKNMVNVTGLIITKLDGSARGGVVVGLADKFGLPIHAVGVGEGADDLQPFSPQSFANGLLGIQNT